MRQQIRQGDVLLVRTSRRPTAAARLVPRDLGRIILAYGEVTGHAHEVVPNAPPVLGDLVPAQQLFEEPNGARLLVVRGPATLRHDEHAPHALLGHYEVIRQREYHPLEIRTVAD